MSFPADASAISRFDEQSLPAATPSAPRPAAQDRQRQVLHGLPVGQRTAAPVESLAPRPSVMIPPYSVTRVVWQWGSALVGPEDQVPKISRARGSSPAAPAAGDSPGWGRGRRLRW